MYIYIYAYIHIHIHLYIQRSNAFLASSPFLGAATVQWNQRRRLLHTAGENIPIYPSVLNPSIHPYTRIDPSIHLSFCRSVSIYIYINIYIGLAYLSVRLSVYLSACLSVIFVFTRLVITHSERGPMSESRVSRIHRKIRLCN